MTVYLKKILDLMGNRKKYLFPIVLLFLFNTLLDLLSLGLIIPFVTILSDESIIESSSYYIYFLELTGLVNTTELIVFFCYILFGVFFFKLIFSILVNYTILRFSFNTVADLKIKLMNGFQDMPYSVFIKRNSSEYIQSILDFSGVFNGSVLMPFLRLLAEILVTLGILIFLLTTQGAALLVILAIVGSFILFYDLMTRKKLGQYGQKGAFANETAIKSVNEAMQGFKEIRVLGKEEGFLKRLIFGAQGNAKFSILSQTLGLIPRYALEFCVVAFVISYVLISILDKNIDLSSVLPTLVVFGVASVRLLPSVSMIVSSITQIRLGEYATNRLYKDLVELEGVSRSKIGFNLFSEFKSLELKNIYFKYEGSSEWAIENFSIKIDQGQSIGIIGPSGSGKTTIVDIILGLLEINSGEILINGHAVDKNPEALKGLCAYLPQEIFIVDDSLQSNIALGEKIEEIDISRVNSAITRSSLNELVANLEYGLDTSMGDKGIRLSGGQRQRVAIGRAFYNERELLVMDESTSALDIKTEEDITSQIDELKGQKTLIIIAHRESTLKRCDKIIKLDRGKLKIL